MESMKLWKKLIPNIDFRKKYLKKVPITKQNIGKNMGILHVMSFDPHELVTLTTGHP